LNELNFSRINLTGQYLQDVQEVPEICGDIGDLSANLSLLLPALLRLAIVEAARS
jgi:hypothetical protein